MSLGWAAAAMLAAGSAAATPIGVDAASSLNGITDIYSATFDGPINPNCTGAPSYCSFFGGQPPLTRALVITPNPTTVENGVPGGIAPAPVSGSFLDLTVNPGNASVTLSGGVVRLPVLIITISGTTVVTATGAGFVIDSAPVAAPVGPGNTVEFLVNLAPALAADFSTLGDVVTNCTGPLCALIPILSLDMIKYRLLIDFDDDFRSFTGDFIGQTGNNSIVFATLNSGQPEIAVADSQPPADDLQVGFGDVTEQTSGTRTVTVSNAGGGRLVLGTVAQANPLAAPFAIANDLCSGQVLGFGSTGSCAFDVVFSPSVVGPFADAFDVPSNDVDESSVQVAVSGNGVANPIPDISVTDSVAPGGDGQVPFGAVTTGSVANQTVTVTNNGTADLTLGQIGMANPLAAPFSVQTDACSNQTLAPAASCGLGLRFEPVAAGAASDSLDIPSNDADTPTFTLAVSGSGAALPVPDIRISDPTAPDDDLQFTFEGVRSSGAFDRLVRISNAGTANLVMGAIAQANPLAAPFSVVQGEDQCSGATLLPGDVCTVRLRFEPTALGAFADAFDVPSSDPDQPSLTVSFSGNGVEAPTASATPEPSGSSSGFMALDAGTLALLGAGLAFGSRRRSRTR